MSLASLPMYDLPEVRQATDSWWAGLARALGRAGVADVPEQLTRGQELATVWQDGSLLFSQTCGYPLTHAMRDVLMPVATPVYVADGCDGADYCSVILVRDDEPATEIAELRGRRVAVNNPGSHSGYNALRRTFAPLAKGGQFFSEVVETGGHPGSIAAVVEGKADLAAVDSITYRLLASHRPESVRGLRVLARTDCAPGLPYVTRADAPTDLLAALRDGLRQALADPSLAEARETLLITDVEELPLAAYARIDAAETEAHAMGYPEVA